MDDSENRSLPNTDMDMLPPLMKSSSNAAFKYLFTNDLIIVVVLLLTLLGD